MKKLSLILFLLSGSRLVFSQNMPADTAGIGKKLMSMEQQMMDAIPIGDSATWDKYLDTQFFIVTEDGTRLDRKAFMASMRPLPKGYSGWIKVINPKWYVDDQTAVINYVSDEYEFVFGQKIHTTYSSMNTWVRKPKGWQMVTSQVFEIPQLPKPVAISPEVLKKYTGTYRLTDTVTCTVTFENDTLYVQKKARSRQALLPETSNVFFANENTRGRKIFIQDDDGGMLMLERRNGQDVAWKRIVKKS
jgi:Domain of unknown function (DUF4440)/Domain of unknown function (DUF3471)